MAQPAEKTLYTPEEYFALEERADYRSEYAYGEIFAMAGGTPEHNLISGDVFSALNAALAGTDCSAFMTDMRVQLQPGKRYTYPDVFVICGPWTLAHNRNDVVTNPIMIIEVLSDSTEAYDRNEKFEAYRQIDTLREYVLISQKRVHVETFVKNGDDSWNWRAFDDLTGDLPLASLNITIPIQAIYRRIELPQKPYLTRVKEREESYGNATPGE